jgi:hypothetical protein
MLSFKLGTPRTALETSIAGWPVRTRTDELRHMTDHELHAFWDDALQMIERELLPHFTDSAERARLAEMLLPTGLS